MKQKWKFTKVLIFRNLFNVIPAGFTYSKLTIKTLEQGMKYVLS